MDVAGDYRPRSNLYTDAIPRVIYCRGVCFSATLQRYPSTPPYKELARFVHTLTYSKESLDSDVCLLTPFRRVKYLLISFYRINMLLFSNTVDSLRKIQINKHGHHERLVTSALHPCRRYYRQLPSDLI